MRRLASGNGEFGAALIVASCAYAAGMCVLLLRRVWAYFMDLNPRPSVETLSVAGVAWILVFAVATAWPMADRSHRLRRMLGRILFGGAALPLVFLMAVVSAPHGFGLLEKTGGLIIAAILFVGAGALLLALK